MDGSNSMMGCIRSRMIQNFLCFYIQGSDTVTHLVRLRRLLNQKIIHNQTVMKQEKKYHTFLEYEGIMCRTIKLPIFK